MRYALTQPRHYTITGPHGAAYLGGDQEWYPHPWQQRAGCGPTTAALCLAYLSQTHPQTLRGLGPDSPLTTQSFLDYMEQIWRFVTPSIRGLDNLPAFTQGCAAFAAHRGCGLTQHPLPLPGCDHPRQPTLAVCAHFLRTALAADCPVAFLNFSNGQVENLDPWHWVPLIWMEERPHGPLLCGILDAGEEHTIDFTRWHATSRAGGGLVSLAPATT